MSRIGKLPLSINKDIKVAVDGRTVRVEGSRGKLQLAIPHGITVEQKDNQLLVTRASDLKQDCSNHGTIRSRAETMMPGVTKGFKKDLELFGLGYRVELKGKKIVFNIGLSHPVEFTIPDDVKVTVASQTSLSVEGSDAVLVGQVAAKIRALKPAEPYKGKGFKYAGEVIRRKQGKSVAKK